MGRMQFSFRDYSEERSTLDFAIVDLSAGNIAANLTAFDAVQTALEGVTDGVVATRRLIALDEVVSGLIPTVASVQRERKWLVRYIDTVTQRPGSFEIPTASPDGLLTAGTDLMNLTLTAPTALVTALEANVRSINGNTINVQQIRLVGRNL